MIQRDQFQLTPFEEANRILLDQDNHGKAVLIVEGHDDRRLMEKFVDTNHCNFEPLHSKCEVVKVMGFIDDSREKGVLAMIDADFDRIIDRFPTSRNIVSPDGHDIETMMIRSPAIENVWREYSSKCKLKSFEGDPREAVENIAYQIGCLRLHSLRTDLNLRFNNMKVKEFVDEENFRMDRRSFVTHIKNRSQKHHIDDAGLLEAIEGVQAEGHQADQLSNGKDIVTILSHGFRKAFGTNDASEVLVTKIQATLRSGYHSSDFEKSKLYSDIRRWESQSGSFRILKEFD